jgi:hypothetical protein
MKTFERLILALSALSGCGPSGLAPNDAATNQFQSVDLGPSSAPAPAALSTPRNLLAVVASVDGTVWAIGGSDAAAYRNTVEQLDPLAGTWRARAPLPKARHALAAAAGTDGRLFVLGGVVGNASGTPLGEVDVYSPADDRWTLAAPLPTPRFGLAAVAGSDGRIWAIGGSDGKTPLATVEVLDPSTLSWSTGPSLATPRLALGACADADGTLWAVGGRDAATQPLDGVEMLAPGGVWRSAAPLGRKRYWLALARGPDGALWAAGGLAGDPSSPTLLDVVERLGGGAWSESVPLPAPRAWGGLVATVGRLYYVGGGESATQPDGAVWRLAPGDLAWR